MKNIFSSLLLIVLENRFYGFVIFRLNKYIKMVSSRVKNGSKILDVGAGQCQYKKHFLHAQYNSQDLCVGDENWDYSCIDIKSEIYSIPVEDESFDYLLCTQVLEHLKYPELAFKEFNRILRGGGELFLTVPLVWAEHQKPHDYFRYTQFALKMLAESHGFEVILMEKEGGIFICIANIIIRLSSAIFAGSRGFTKTSRFISLSLYPITFFIAFICYFLDKFDKDKDLTLQYECIFRKIANTK